MTVHQDIDALTMMNIPAEKVLVLPRLAAVLVMMPVLIIFAKIVVWSGGSMVAKHVNYLGISPESYFAALRHYTKFKDVISGMAKAEAFGFVVVLVCCAIGLNTRGGPPEIGTTVARTVVVSLITILTVDYFVTKLLL